MSWNGYVDNMVSEPVLVWDKFVPDTKMETFKKLIEKKYNRRFSSYWDFHKWSVENYIQFWDEVWQYFNITTSKSHSEVFVKTGSGFLDNEWFSGTRFNLAENILRIRDNRIGLICDDELGNRETFTFADIFEQVKLYTAAFLKCGLNKGDRVGYYMSNRKEALFAMLATASIGAIWGGPTSYYGPRAASRIMKTVDPKIIISVDHFQDDGYQCYLIENLRTVVEDLPNLKKVIIVVTKKETLSRGISDIPKSIYLDDFLEKGRRHDGTVQELVFEHLPFNHPTAINFTSGTTDIPKGVVHSAGAIITQLRDFAFHLNLKTGDVVYMHCPVGWAVWDYHIPSLALGVQLLLFNGSPAYNNKGTNIWKTLADNKVKYAFLPAGYLDLFEKNNIVPDADTNLDSLKILALGASPVKPRYYEFLHMKVKHDLVICSWYGATEVFGVFTGFDFNTPLYKCELQAPALGVDLHCFDNEGNSVVGKRGELVVVTPNPAFPVYLWKDVNNARLNESYLSKFAGVWAQNDECWINPKTKGIVLIGRSDDTLKQSGERFGSADIYFAIDEIEELEDYICVGQPQLNGDTIAILFVKMKKGFSFTLQLKEKISETIETDLSSDCIPQVIMEIPDIPYNLNHKRMESTVRKIVETNIIPEVSNIKNPECLQHYCDIPELLNLKGSRLV